jgi:hypothetical protein
MEEARMEQAVARVALMARLWLSGACGAVMMLIAAPALAQIDITGSWATQMHEDQPHRVPGAELGDYTGLPINDAARTKASTWDASVLSLPERMTQPHPAQYFMWGPGPDMRIQARVDPVTTELVAYTIEGVFGRDDRIIWMDGRPHPSPNAEHLWEGFSTGKVVGNQLIVTTTHMKFGTLQRNGVPSSPDATITEIFMRHGDMLTLMSVVDDPAYLEEPMVRTSHWLLTANVRVDERWNFEVVDEIANRPQGVVPHLELGTKQDRFSSVHGIPFEATQGGKETIYPEYQQKLRQLVRDHPAPPPPPKPAATGGDTPARPR